MSKLAELCDLEELVSYVESISPDIIVVEGYNGVGKSRVIEVIQERYHIHAYRPPYDGWSGLLPKEYRWAIFASFMDVFRDQELKKDSPLLFDRGMISGMVYNNSELSKYYRDIVRNSRVLQILVTCSEEDYVKFLGVRSSEKVLDVSEFREMTGSYEHFMEVTGSYFLVFRNSYDEDFGNFSSRTCRGCGHYNVGDSYCKHPDVKAFVPLDCLRCSHSSELEVQDIGKLQEV